MDSRLKTYALTAGSTAALAAAGSAAADIITSDGPTSIIASSTGSPQTLFSISSMDVIALNLGVGNWSTAGYGIAALGGVGGTGFAVQSVTSGACIDSNLNSGKPKSKAVHVVNFQSGNTGTSKAKGGLESGTENLIAFNVVADSQKNYYGWINFSLTRVEDELTFTINSWAYNDVAGQGIIAGQNTAKGSAVVPGLGGLAGLAIGAAGVRTRRQRIA